MHAGFADRGGKGSHRNLGHPKGIRVTVSGKAKHYQERDVRTAVLKVAKARGAGESLNELCERAVAKA